MNIIIFGGPGAGKGTHGVNISNDFGLERIIAGNILRDEANSGSDLGNQLKAYTSTGNLVPDELLNVIIRKHVVSYDNIKRRGDINGIIFDGFPRRVSQAEFLDSIINIDVVIGLEVSDENLKSRLLKRGENSNRVDDKDPKIIEHRIKVYNAETKLVIDHYKKLGKYFAIDANKSVDEIYSEILKFLSSI